MPTSVLADDDEQIIADLQRDVRRLRSRLATTAPRGGHDAWTAAATPATTYQLSTIPVLGTCEFAINGHEQREGTDYSCNYDTGLVTVSAALSSGDKLVARYLITDWLVARSLAPCLEDDFNRVANSSSPNPASDGGTWTVFAGTYGIEVISGVAHLYNSGFGLWASGGSGSNTNGPDPLGGNPAMGRDLGSAAQNVTWRIHCDDATDRFVMVNFDPTTRSAYMLSTDGSTIFRLWHSPANTPGSRTLLASFTFTTFTTSTVRVTHDGAGHLEVFQDGVSLGTVTDASPLTGTWVGVAEATNGSTHTANWWDSFSACPS